MGSRDEVGHGRVRVPRPASAIRRRQSVVGFPGGDQLDHDPIHGPVVGKEEFVMVEVVEPFAQEKEDEYEEVEQGIELRFSQQRHSRLCEDIKRG